MCGVNATCTINDFAQKQPPKLKIMAGEMDKKSDQLAVGGQTVALGSLGAAEWVPAAECSRCSR